MRAIQCCFFAFVAGLFAGSANAQNFDTYSPPSPAHSNYHEPPAGTSPSTWDAPADHSSTSDRYLPNEMNDPKTGRDTTQQPSAESRDAVTCSSSCK
jgi:hypothetical protein